MRVVFIGSSKFGLRCLEKLIVMPFCQVVGVLTAPETISISYNPSGFTNVLHGDVLSSCQRNNIPYHIIGNGMNDDLLSSVKEWRPDIFVVVGWYHMIPKKWRDVAPCYGMHASLLPDYSGGAPLVWAMINGEKKTGITLFQLAEGVDNGPILGQEETPIYEDDTIVTLYARIEKMGLDLLEKYIPMLDTGGVELFIQDEYSRRIFPQRKPEDGFIDWSRSAREIYNFIRAQTRPYPGAFSILAGHKISIWSAHVIQDNKVTGRIIGDIFKDSLGFCVNCGDSSVLYLGEISIDGMEVTNSSLLNMGDRFN